MLESFDNVGAIVRVGDLVDAIDDAKFDEELFEKLNSYIKKIGYKKRLDEEETFDQTDAWNIEIKFIKDLLKKSDVNRNVFVLFEYMLPNENTIRPDIVLLNKEKVSIFELKAIGRTAKPGYVAQYIDYRKIVKNYHFESAEMDVEAYLVMCNANNEDIYVSDDIIKKISEEDKKRIIGKDGFLTAINSLRELTPMTYGDVITWINSKRKPSKSIAEKGKEIKKALMQGPDGYYSKISNVPIEYIKEPIDAVFQLSKEKGKKIIFISGVPGAGKTLVGMILLFGIMGMRDANNENKQARYYTGNGALRNVLSNELDAKSDISSMSGFRSYHVINRNQCDENVLIFDEAQRFWSAEKVQENISQSIEDMKNKEDKKNEHSLKAYQEYADLIEQYMSDADSIINAEYTKDNITIVCLIGDGQKPMYGEAGLEAWIEALKNNSSWDVYIPKEKKKDFEGIKYNDEYDLHLSVSQRTHFVNMAPWVEAVLAGDLNAAKKEVSGFYEGNNTFEIRVTRSLGEMYKPGVDGYTFLERYKQRKENVNKNEVEYLYGILCSSNRYSIVRDDRNKYTVTSIDKLSENVLRETYNKETRKYENSNLYIENEAAYLWYSGECCDRNAKAATETFCQGLEVDLPIVFFRGDYILNKIGNDYKWNVNISDYAKRKLGDNYFERIQDAYRILLTRATEEMILVVPDKPEFNDLYDFFIDSGIKELEII